MKLLTKCMVFGISLFLFACSNNQANETKTELVKDNTEKAEKSDNTKKAMTEKATFGGGCFWCVEAIYEHVDGVVDMTSGYEGGQTKNPTYKEICTGLTGHAEVVQLEFDPKKVSYERLLAIFFQTHDPTTLNRQGNDIGTQYRSIIFYHSDEQKKAAETIIKKLDDAKVFDKKIVTKVEKTQIFYPAEDYHQDYYKRNPNQGYCQAIIRPKLEKFLKSLEKEKK